MEAPGATGAAGGGEEKSSTSSSSSFISAWVDDFTKRVELPEAVAAKQRRRALEAVKRRAADAEAARVKREEEERARAEEAEEARLAGAPPTVMRPSGAQTAASARLIGAVFDAVLKNRKRLFYNLIDQPLNEWMDEMKIDRR